MRVVSFMNYKGGVGKTTTAANIGAGLAARGKRVLLIDLDPQANLTASFVPDTDDDVVAGLQADMTIKRWFEAHTSESGIAPPLSELVTIPVQVKQIVEPRDGKLALIASHLSLLDIDMRLAARLFAEDPRRARINHIKLHRILADALEDEEVSSYDYVLIDCAPDFGIVTRIAMVATDFVVVPAKAEPLSTMGMGYLVQSLRRLVDEYNALSPAIRFIKPEFLGVVFNMVQIYSGQPIASQQNVIKLASERIDIPVFKTMLRNASRTAISSTKAGVPAVLNSSGDGEVVAELNALTDEFLRRIEKS